MRQLTALDAQFLSVESATTTAHVAGLAILDPTTAPNGVITRRDLVDLLRQRLHLAPPLRMRLVGVPFGLDRPYWVDDPRIDPDQHVTESVLPAPGDDQQLAAHVARIHARRLDRRRPLWEAHLIRGLAGGRVALYFKVHHCAVDGVTGAEILTTLLDPGPEPRRVEMPPPTPPTSAPGRLGMLAGALTRSIVQPVETVCSLARVVADLDTMPLISALPESRLVARVVRALAGDSRTLPELPPLAVPRTPFNGPITAQRDLSFGSIPLAQIRRVARAFGMSPNDVVMTLCATALRHWLLARDALPDQPLVAAVPVALRKGGDRIGNRISAVITPLATHLACSKERLAAIQTAMAAARRRFVVSHKSWLNDVCAIFPTAFSAVATPVLFRLAGLAGAGVNLIVSNVPGPPAPLYLCGARMLSYHPMSVVTDVTGGISITCLSYAGQLDFGVVVCPSRVPDVWTMISHLRDAMDELLAMIEVQTPPEISEKIPA